MDPQRPVTAGGAPATNGTEGNGVAISGPEDIAPSAQLLSAFAVLKPVHAILKELRYRRDGPPGDR